jgi:dienelactone hydrolase
MRLAVLFAAVFAASGTGVVPAVAQTLEIHPAHVLQDEQAVIRATGLKPGEHAVIRAEMNDREGHRWSAEAEFAADGDGVIDASSAAPVKGSYRNVSAMGLVWSMKPSGHDVRMFVMPRDLDPLVITFHLLVDHREAATAQLEQASMKAGEREVHLTGALSGSLFLPAEAGPRPAVLVVGGSDGGTPLRRAAWLASHGYVALALCYFKCEGRPENLENIPLEYFGEALVYLMHRPEVDGQRLAVMGTSRGGELALQLGSMYPALKAVVAYVPANVRYSACCGFMVPRPSWTWKGKALAYAAPRDRDDLAEKAAATIFVEQTHGPILMIGGEDDYVWPSAEMVTAAAERLRHAHFEFPVTVLKYPHAGHRAGMPEILPTWNEGIPRPRVGTPAGVGGSAEGNAESTLDAIPKVLGFLAEALGK